MPDTVTPLMAPTLAAGNSSVQDLLLSQLDTADPTTALLIQWFANKSQESENANIEESDEDETSPRYRLKKLSSAFRHLRDKHERLQAELKELQLRNDTLAAALGACYLCWGEYQECDICNGKGNAGYFPIDMPAFSQTVLPAVRTLKEQRLTNPVKMNVQE